MRIRCEKDQLLSALQVVQKATATKTTLPILTGIYLSAAQSFSQCFPSRRYLNWYSLPGSSGIFTEKEPSFPFLSGVSVLLQLLKSPAIVTFSAP